MGMTMYRYYLYQLHEVKQLNSIKIVIIKISEEHFSQAGNYRDFNMISILNRNWANDLTNTYWKHSQTERLEYTLNKIRTLQLNCETS